VLARKHSGILESMNNLAEGEGTRALTPRYSDKPVLSCSSPHPLAPLQRIPCSVQERACAGYEAVLRKDHPTTRACRQHYTDELASQEQSQLVTSPTVAGSTKSARIGKGSKVLRGLAKIGMRSSKSSAR
jgi:hypothetical protein